MRQVNFMPIAIMALNAYHDPQREKNVLKNRGFTAVKELVGCYKGQRERAWLIPVFSNEDFERIVVMARDYDQESVLYSGLDRESELVYTADDRREYIGVLIPTTEKIALAQDAYTYDPQADQYWIVHKREFSTKR